MTTLNLKRLDPTLFVGLGEWSRLAADGTSEDCLVELTIELTASGKLRQIVRERLCA